MGSTYLSPAAKRKMPDPNPYPDTSNGAAAKRSKQPLSSQISFRLLCHSSRVGGVIGKSGSVIKQLQQSTGAKIRIEDAPSEYPDRVITVAAPTTISGRFDVDGSEIDVSKAQDALVRVFERILEVAMESNGAAVAAGVVSCRLLIESSQVGSVIGKGGKIVEKIRKECGCKIRVLKENLPACAGPTDQVVEIEGDVVAVKKGLIAVSRQLQDSPAVDNTRMVRPVETPPQEILHKPREVVAQEIVNRYYEVVQQEPLRRPLDIAPLATLRRPLETVQETLPNHRTDFLSQRNIVLSYVPTSSVSYASGVNHLSLESDRFQNVDRKSVQQEVMFKILCGVDRVGGIIGKGGGIIKALQNETGATITIGNSVSECDDRLITITASENPESQYSPAQKATVLVFSRIIETGFEKGLDAGSSKGSSVTARLAVPSNVVGCLLGKGGTIISEMRKITGTGIHITAGDQAPKCVSDNEQVIQILGEFSKVKDAVYRVTAKLRDNLFSSVLISARTRNISSISTEASPYGRSLDPASLRLQPSVGVSHSISRHSSLTQGMDRRGLSHGLDQHGLDQCGLSHGFDQHGLSHGLDQHDLDQRGLSHGFDQHGLSHGLDQRGLDQRGLSHGLDQHGLDQRGLSHGLDQHGLSQSLDQRGLSHSSDQHGLSHSHGFDQHGLSHSHGLDQRGLHHDLDQHGISQGMDQHGLSHDLDQCGLSHGLDQRGLSHGLDRPLSPPRLWASQTVAGVNSRDITDVARGVSSFKGGFELGSGGKSAIVTNTTVEIKVPESVIGCVYGENGNNLARLRQISGAKVIVHQPRYGSSDRIIVISGTPDETQAAQSLLQAFILTGPSS